MKHCLFLLPLLLVAADDHPTGPRQTPPTLRDYSPRGFARGLDAELTVEGFNLAGASAIYFSEPGITARILRIKELPDLPDIRLGSNGTPSTVDVGPLPPRNQVTLQLSIPYSAKIGPVRFRLLTPLGTTPAGTFLVEPFWGEAADAEPNNTPETAQELFLPAILAGSIQRPGDQDVFKVRVEANQKLTFENPSPLVGSNLNPVVAILDEEQTVLAEYGYHGDRSTRAFQHTFAKAGTYFIRISDYLKMAGGTYRLKVGEFPILTSAYPLGFRRGQSRSFQLRGFNLPASVAAAANPEPGTLDFFRLRPDGAFNEIRLAASEDPEFDLTPAQATNAAPHPVPVPAVFNGIMTPEPRYFAFDATQGQDILIEVAARRLGSELDSVIDILTPDFKPIERAVAQPVWETNIVLADRDASAGGLRIGAWTALAAGDYILSGSEIMRVRELPHSPDEDVLVDVQMGQRESFFGTTAEAHSVDKPVYKVAMHPPGVKLAPNGMPVARLTWRNDDGGTRYGKDSYLRFTPPASGRYLIRLADVNGAHGPDHSFRLHVRPPRPNFRITANLLNPNVPAGGTIPVTVAATRLDGFDGPIEVTVEDLPHGLSATKGLIAARQSTGLILLSAAPGVKLAQAVPFKLSAAADISGKSVTRQADAADPLRLLAVAPPPDITLTTSTQEITLEPGQQAEVTVRIQRHNGFKGRVPVQVLNLPARVRPADVGLNGVLLNEDEDTRTFPIEAFPTAEPVEQTFYLAGVVETRSNQQNAHAAPVAIKVRVLPKKSAPSRD
jgi:hypothetical protein